MLAPLTNEILKLNRSLAALLALAAPSLIAVFVFFNLLRFDEGMPWEMVIKNAAAIWAFFMMPMSVTALTALVAQMEHGPKSWDHLFALPVPRWRIIAAKAVSVFGLVAAMSAGVLVLTVLAAKVAAAAKPEIAPTGVLDWADSAVLIARMYLAATLMIALQLWVALRFRSFVPPLILGIGGTFFAVVATSAKAGVFMPWQMPINMLATDGDRAGLALTLGGIGGLILLAAMLIHLSRRDVS